VDKKEFRRRLERAGERARQCAEQYVIEPLPSALRLSLPEIDDPRGARGPVGTIKFFGGRFLRPEELVLVSPARAADLLWVNGRVPAWVNLNVEYLDEQSTHIRVRCSHTLLTADQAMLSRDIVVDPADPVEPFRIRGPALVHGWRSVELDGKICLLNTKDLA
jgi:hypothetical protein